MSGIVEELALSEAARTPALRLVSSRYSGLVLASLRLSFGAHGTQVPAARLHAQVDAYLEELLEAGGEVPQNANGRALCLSWVREGWLSRVPGEEGEEAYERTSHALNAERVVATLSRAPAMLNESRLRTIVDAVHRWALEAQPDREARIRDLEQQITALSRERTRLAEGGELPRADEERMRHGYTDVVDLLEQLPGDFRRVEEAVEEIHRKMIQDFRTEERDQGEVLDSYLEAARNLMTAGPAGRAFETALDILGDEERLESFRADLRAIMDHPFAESLSARRRRDFTDAAGVLRRGLYDVQARQHQASRSLAEYLTHAEPARERELSTVLHQVESELSIWLQTARRHDRVPVPGSPSRAEIAHLRRREDSLAPAPDAAPLQDVTASAPVAPNLEEVMRFGGPLQVRVAEALLAAGERGADSVPEAFDALPEPLRRPVELFGLMQLATDHGLVGAEHGEDAVVTTVRPDGTRRRMSMPTLPLDRDMLAHDETEET